MKKTFVISIIIIISVAYLKNVWAENAWFPAVKGVNDIEFYFCVVLW